MGKWKFQTLQISSSTSIMKDRVGPQLRQLLINGSLDWQPLTHQYRPAALQYMTPESWQPEAIQSTFQRYRKPDDVGGWAQLCVCNYWLQTKAVPSVWSMSVTIQRGREGNWKCHSGVRDSSRNWHRLCGHYRRQDWKEGLQSYPWREEPEMVDWQGKRVLGKISTKMFA